MTQLSNKLTYTIVLALVLTCIALALLPRSSRFSISDIENDKTPDWFMSHMTATRFDKTGDIAGITKTPHVKHQPQQDILLLKTPFFILYDENRVPWHINALKGTVYQSDDKRIVLDQKVKVQQMPGKSSDNVTLTTTHLTYFPNTSMAKTPEAVTIIEPGMVMHSIGFEANLKKGELKFLSETHGQYDDSKKSL